MSKSGIAVLALILAACASPPVRQPAPPERLAACIARTGVRLYGASWCHWCHVQIKMFGADAPLVPYVDCDPESTLTLIPECVAKGFAFDSPLPTWILADGSRLVGLRSLAALAQRTGCPAP
jgi:hypothetical protein